MKVLRDKGLLAAPAGSSGVGYRGKQVSQQDNDMVVKILLAEAAAGSDEDIRNIAWVIRNRVSRSKMSPYEVVTSPAQFSAYGDGKYRRERSAEDIERATKIWNEVINAPPSSDPTGGADHYFATYIRTPRWAKNLAEGSRGQLSKESPHVFFNAAAVGKGFRNSGGKSEYFAQTDETYQEDVAKTTEQPETVELNTARAEAIRQAVPNADNIIPNLNAAKINDMSEEQFGALVGELQKEKAIPSEQQVNNTVERISGAVSAIGDPRDQFGITGSAAARGVKDVDPRLVNIAEEAAKTFPLRVRLFSGKRDKGAHGKGWAIDTQLFDETGKPIASYQTQGTATIYRMWAEHMRATQQKLYPELNKEFVWGGGFSGKNNFGSRD